MKIPESFYQLIQTLVQYLLIIHLLLVRWTSVHSAYCDPFTALLLLSTTQILSPPKFKEPLYILTYFFFKVPYQCLVVQRGTKLDSFLKKPSENWIFLFSLSPKGFSHADRWFCIFLAICLYIYFDKNGINIYLNIYDIYTILLNDCHPGIMLANTIPIMPNWFYTALNIANKIVSHIQITQLTNILKLYLKLSSN